MLIRWFTLCVCATPKIDAQAVVYHSHYLVYYDIAITEFLRRATFNQVDYAAATGHDFHLVKSSVVYRRAIRYDQMIDVCAAIERIGTSSITWRVALFGTDDGSCRSTGEIIWVHTNLTNEQSTPVPEDLVQRFSAVR